MTLDNTPDSLRKEFDMQCEAITSLDFVLGDKGVRLVLESGRVTKQFLDNPNSRPQTTARIQKCEDGTLDVTMDGEEYFHECDDGRDVLEYVADKLHKLNRHGRA